MSEKNPSAPSAEVLQEEVRRLRRAVEELSILNDIARAISASLNSEEIMQTLIRKSLKAVNAEQGVITLVEAEERSMKTLIRTMVSSAGAPAFHMHQALIGWMHLNKKPLSVDSPANDPRFRGVQWDGNIKTLLCVPLIVKSELRGVLTVYNKKDGNSFNADDQRLLAIIAAQSAQVVENARLIEEEKLYIKMQQEVGLAAKIQGDLLPRNNPDLPGYDIAARTISAQSIGGDYYDFIPMGDGRMTLCLGDVSGKGLPASLLMANLQATLRGQTLVSPSPSECLVRSNKLLYESTSPEKFATLFYAILDPASHTIHYSNAGHDWPHLIAKDSSVKRLQTGGLMLGLIPEVGYEDEKVGLEAGALLVIQSDGISEAMNSSEEQFGEERLQSVLLRERDRSAAEIVDAVVREVRSHAGAHPQSDDITIMVVKRVQ
ncbi:MAG TPA: GAF domain-containing SpoIIE family protein phosphatase [Bacteroidota bacterium]|nr:GAF domain-containing SpoIIE family protein phosphatase [Bacteroidota bacterium]